MNDELFNFVGFAEIHINQAHSEQKRRSIDQVMPSFSSGVLAPFLKHILENDGIVFQALARFWVVLVVFDLFPADAGRSNEIPFEVFFRDTAVFL